MKGDSSFMRLSIVGPTIPLGHWVGKGRDLKKTSAQIPHTLGWLGDQIPTYILVPYRGLCGDLIFQI